jgi:hypothetical protein
VKDAEYTEGPPATRFEVKLSLATLNGESTIAPLVLRWGQAPGDDPSIELSIGALRCELSLFELARVADLARMSLPPMVDGTHAPMLGGPMPPFIRRR